MERGERLSKLWESQWWLDEEHAGTYRNQFSPEQMDRAFRRVAEVFDAEWENQMTEHPYLGWMLATGLLPLFFIYGLGEDLISLEGSLRLASVIEDLKHPTNCDSARLELEMAAILRRKRHEIEFRPRLPNGKQADFVASLVGQHVYFELKRMRESQRQIAITQLIHSVSLAMSKVIGHFDYPQVKNQSYRVELADFSTRLGQGLEQDRQTIQQVTDLVLEHIEGRARAGVPLDFTIPSVASVFIGDTGNESSSVTGPRIPPDDEMVRILRGHFRDALKQIHPDHPGIIAIQTPAYLLPTRVKEVLETLLEHHIQGVQQLSVVLFLPVYYSFPERWSIFKAFPVRNKRAKFPADTLKAYRDLREVFGS